jgi:zinc and cadmium transporter
LIVLLIAVGLSVVGSLGGLLVASLLLLLKGSVRQTLVPALISYAVGTLLGVALLKLLPEALDLLDASLVLGTLLAGILSFFMLEKLVIWRHCHQDGCIIGAAVLSSIPLGVSTAMAVAAHQVPQEVGDFAILLGAGYSRRRALALNGVAALAGVLGACLVYVTAGWVPNALPYILAFAGGNFMYVAMADLIPGLHRGAVDTGALRQVLLVAAGVATIVVL